MTEHQLTTRPIGPWFRQRPKSAVAVATGLYLTVGAGSLCVVDDRAAMAVVLVLPVSLLAVTFGRRGGLIGGAAAVSLYAVRFLEPGGRDWEPPAGPALRPSCCSARSLVRRSRT